MTPDRLIAYAKRKFGEKWKAKLAREFQCHPSTIGRIESGETPEVSRRMELEMKAFMRREQFAHMAAYAKDVRY